jgi:Fuc2NAc and GlcNAc transferase
MRGLLAGWILAVFCFGTFLLSLGVTAAARRFALRRGFIDVPNERSSHSMPTPRSGGMGIVASFLSALATLTAISWVDVRLFAALSGGGLLVAAIGLADDRRHIPAALRLAAHFAAASWALYWLGGMQMLQFGDYLVNLGAAGNLVAAIAIVWSLNLFNFMDGIDGIAASEGASVSWAAALLVGAAGGLTSTGGVAWVLGAAALGFLCWNWPPAKIFMGDIGSGFLGFVIAVLAIAESIVRPQMLLPWVILFGAFIVDATVTLLRRVIRGRAPHVAHRSHAYQRLARAVGHRRVTLGFIAINLLWLLPIAWCAMRRPALALWLAALALVPLLIVALSAGAGKEHSG